MDCLARTSRIGSRVRGSGSQALFTAWQTKTAISHSKTHSKEDSTFKIARISDTHMVTGVGTCKDAIDEDGRFLPASVADPLTVKFLGEVLDLEKPDLVLLTGDQIHHDIPDSQSTIFKVVAPLIERSIPFAAVFGNHDSEGEHALSRAHHFLINTRFDFRFANEAVSSPTF